ncbi:MAG TPA: hypothetical protein VJV23_06305 [Candidatus Polarisedimenticolia bacterium]|nr:hypothetical protein [Candidatus Polarisedimenticolia bacterium]
MSGPSAGPGEPPAIDAAPRRPRLRVLVGPGPAAESLAGPLQGDGHEILRPATPGQARQALQQGDCAAAVLDFGGGSPCSGSEAEWLDAAGAAGRFVLAFGEAGRPGPAGGGAVWLGRDETDRGLRDVRGAMAARALAVAVEENERLLAAVMHARRTAHDLAQPLTTILARAQLLQLKLKPDDPNARPIGIICQEAERLVKLSEQFHKLREMMLPPETQELRADRAAQEG